MAKQYIDALNHKNEVTIINIFCYLVKHSKGLCFKCKKKIEYIKKKKILSMHFRMTFKIKKENL